MRGARVVLPPNLAAALLLAAVLAWCGCTSGSDETVTDIFNPAVGLEDLDPIDLSVVSDLPWDYPDIVLGDDKIQRLIWMKAGEGDPYKSLLDATPLVAGKKVAVTIVKNFPKQLYQEPENGNIQALSQVSLEALSLIGLPEDVDVVTEILVGYQKSIPQVEVSVRIVEVIEADAFSFGIDTAFSSVESDPDSPTRTFFNTAATMLGLPEIPGRGGTFSPGSLSTPLLIDLGTITHGVQVDFLIRALKLFSRTDVLSAPHMRVLDGHVAKINAGEQIPFFTPTFNSNGLNAVTTTFKSVGIKLFIIPKVVGRDVINISLTTTVDAVTGESTFESESTSVTNPVITTREASTYMSVHDGDTAIIGGLLTRSKFSNENRVPVLGEIPILNVLFSSRSKQTVQSNLIFFISPRIVDPNRDRPRMITPVPSAEDSGDSGGEDG